MNISLKSKVRHWFNFYRMALDSTDPSIIANVASSAEFYKDWGDVRNIGFEDWWKSHSTLFNERQFFEVLEGEFNTADTHLYLKVPLNASPLAASKVFTRIYREEQEKRHPDISKVKKSYVGKFQLTPLEFQAVNFRYYTIFADRVYLPLLKQVSKPPKTKQLVELAKEKFKNLTDKTIAKSRSGDKQRVAPFRQDIEEDYSALSRTATRYRMIVDNLIRNASLGIFPGEYQESGLKNLYEKRKEAKDPNVVPRKPGPKRKARPIGYQKATVKVDENNPTDRKIVIRTAGI